MAGKFLIKKYICACGCKNIPGKMLRVRERDREKDTQVLGCPKHKARIIGYICECVNCGKKFETESRQQRCPEHKEEHLSELHKTISRRYRENYVKKEVKQKPGRKPAAKKTKTKKPWQNDHLRDISRSDCVNIRECRDRLCYTKIRVFEAIPCRGCGKYQADPEIDIRAVSECRGR